MLAACTAWGAGPREFLIQNWTRDEGLPGNTVTSIAQTPDGYLWLGTFNGLARFDGVRFVSIDLKELAGLQDSSVTCLSSDFEGNLWIGTGNGHLVRFSRGEFAAFQPPSRQSPDRSMQRLAVENSGAVWSLNYEGNLTCLKREAFLQLTNLPTSITAIAGWDRGLWIASPDELSTIVNGEWSRWWDQTREPDFKPEAVTAARAGGCWVAGNGMVRRFADGRPRETRAQLQGKPAAVTAIHEDRQGNVWIGTYGGGVEMLAKNGPSRRLTREQGLPSDLVRCLFEDRDGNLWAGLEGRGLTRIRRALFASYGRAEGLSDETALTVCEGTEDDVWIGTNGDGVYRIANGAVRHYGVKEGLTNQFVWALQPDRDGRLWAGTWGDGLYKFDRDRFLNTRAELGPASVVLALHCDKSGRLWLGQRTGPERVIGAIEHGRLSSFTAPGDLPRLDVRTIAETPDGSLWFGTVEQGLLRWKDGQFIRCDSASGLDNGGINTLHVDHGGDLWVAAPGKGLLLWKDERFTEITAVRRLLDDNLNQITDDGMGSFWFGLRSGIIRMREDHLRQHARGEDLRLEWQRFTKADGLPSNECSGTGCRGRDGRIWFPTLAGVAALDPREVSSDSMPPPVRIEEATLAGRQIFDGQEKALAQDEAVPVKRSSVAGLGSASGLKIPPGGGPLDIKFTAFNFTAPERVRFRYQLVGLDREPMEAGQARSVRYSYLPPGEYAFRVTACNEGGDWNGAGAVLAFEVLPHYWQAWWFQLPGVVLLLGMTAVSARWILLRRLHHRMTALEQQRALEMERSRIAQDLHDDLGTSLTEINFLSAMAGSASSSPSDIKGSLEGINEKSLELVKALDVIVWAVNPKNDSLRNLVNYLCLFAQSYLRPTGIQCRLDVPQGLPELPLNAQQRHTLFLVTKEALANAAKHSGASELWLRVTLLDSVLTLTVEDNGMGFDAAHKKPGRNGLANIESRMRQLTGWVRVTSTPGQGTRVEMGLPLV